MCPNIFTKKEAEELLRISTQTLEKLLSKREIEHFKINGRVRISEDALNAFIDAKTVCSASCATSIEKKSQMMAN